MRLAGAVLLAGWLLLAADEVPSVTTRTLDPPISVDPFAAEAGAPNVDAEATPAALALEPLQQLPPGPPNRQP
jgi:hypothetical protein